MRTAMKAIRSLPLALWLLATAAYASILQPPLSGTAPAPLTCSSSVTGGNNTSYDIYTWQLTGNSAYTLPPSGCVDGSKIEIRMTQGVNANYVVTANTGMGTLPITPGMIGNALMLPASTGGAANVMLIHLWEYIATTSPPSWALLTPLSNPAQSSLVAISPLGGTGTITNPLGFGIGLPIAPVNGGTGQAALLAHALVVGEGTTAVNSVALAKDQICLGGTSGTSADPVASSNYIIGANGHLQVRSNPPMVTSGCGSGWSVTGGDSSFSVQVGSGTVTSCGVQFQNPMPAGRNCTATSSINLAIYSVLNPVMVTSTSTGVTISGQSPGADIGCETVVVSCPEDVN